jgi:hypothetical protein
MPGDDRVRHCPQCHLDVYNFSEMSKREIAELLKARSGRLCARFYQRADGTMLERSCKAGARVPSNPSLLATATLAALASIAPAPAATVPQSATVASSPAHPAQEVLSLVVLDPAGGVVSGATVSLVNTQTGERFEARTDDRGEFLSSTLPAGTYDLTVTLAGFNKFAAKGITTPSNLTITITLQVAVLMGEVVFVVEQPSPIESSATLSEPPSLTETAPLTLKPATHPNFLQRFFGKLHRAFQ